jgi:hypothetical protein
MVFNLSLGWVGLGSSWGNKAGLREGDPELNLFGPERVSTQRDIAETDVFNVAWTGSYILSRVCSTVSLLPLKGVVPYRCNAPVGYYRNVYSNPAFGVTRKISRKLQFPNNTKILVPARHGSGFSSLRLLPVFQLGSGPQRSSFAWQLSQMARPVLSSPAV